MSQQVGTVDADALRSEPAFAKEFLVRILSSLVATESVNPGVYEASMAKRVAEWLEGTPAEIRFVESLPERPSVAAVLKGSGDGPRLVLNGHMDTVPIDDPELWSAEPFGAEVRNGFLYGRGACDMKAGLTVQVAVAHYLAKHHDRLRGSLVLHFAVGEECAEPGTLSLIEAGFTGDYGITTEPTELKVATAERGLAFYRIRVKGRSIHASRAHLGLNPIPRIRAVLDVVEAYEREVKERKHELLPGGSCTPTILRAGVKENAVPDYCDVVVDRRLLPGETVDGEMEALRSRLEEIHKGDGEFEFEISKFPNFFEPAEIAPESPLAKRVLDTVEEVTGNRTEIYGTPYASDVRNLVNDAGMEAVTFGPGNVAECHCADERVSLTQVRDAALVTAKVASDLLMSE
jgi:succinyl-diaminopimelate desuccinylase